MSNVIELSAFKGARSPKLGLHCENGERIEASAMGRPYRRSGRNMHSFVFRNYSLIVGAPRPI